MVKILGLCGQKGSGKDTAAEPLLDAGWARISFADPLKDLCADTFGIKPAKFHHPDFKDLKFVKPLVLDTDHANNFISALDVPIHGQSQANLIFDAFEGREIYSARELLQFIGTDVIRNCISVTYWVDLAEKKLKRWIEEGVNVVFTDVRMANERDLIKDYGGTIVRINRKRKKETTLDKHVSEKLNFGADLIIFNEGSIEELHENIKELA